jgi:hypothetical protein
MVGYFSVPCSGAKTEFSFVFIMQFGPPPGLVFFSVKDAGSIFVVLAKFRGVVEDVKAVSYRINNVPVNSPGAGG